MPATIDPQTYWESRLAENFNARGVGDIGLPETYNRFLYRIRRQVFRRALRRCGLETSSARVLDVGSGTGFYVGNWLAAGVGELTGSDLTHVAVEQLSGQFPAASFRQLDIGEPENWIEPGSFNAVSAFDVLFHIVDDDRFAQAVSNCASALVPGGLFFYSDNLLQEAFDVTHQVGRTEATILSALESAGLVVEQRVPMFVLMNDPVRTRSRLLRKLFSMTYRFASRSPFCGTLAGGGLYPLESLLVRMVSQGPSTEVLVCRRR